MRFDVEIDHEDDGRWIAEMPALPGCLAYGASRKEAVDRAESLALRILADRIEAGEAVPDLADTFLVPA